MYLNGDNVIYLDSFGVEYIPKEMTKFTGNKNITTNIYKIQANDSVMHGYFLNFLDNFFPNKYKKNNKIILIFSLITKNFFYE